GAGVMLNQLLLAAAIWCLLEYRAGKESRWLNAAALIWGLGMAQNWVMLVNGMNPHSPWSFGEAWLATLKITKNTFGALYHQFWAWHRLMTLVVVLYFLVPILPCLVRLQDRGGKNKSKVERLQMWIYRAARAGLLLACLWLAFDPSVGPQQILLRQFGIALPLLSFDY